MRVTIPSPLLSYTDRREVTAEGATVAEVLQDLDRQFPGLRFRMVDEQDRIRQHMRIFLDATEIRELTAALPPDATLHIVQALSGG
ncbi:MAG: MoaD/ThiS family protein [Pseudomonadota bacterium]